jgi:23S rRNA pseudouridine1911/1915/1917 synthase
MRMPLSVQNTQARYYYRQWPVLYADNHVLALYKPAGLLVQGDATQDITLLELGKAWVKMRYRKPGKVYLGMVHRLDRPVAGAVVVARTSKAAGRLSAQFRSGTVKKCYLAIVEGHLSNPVGRLSDHLERSGRTSRVVDQPSSSGQEARLGYRVIATHRSWSLVEIDLETGRRHQIRLQFAHLGHPLVGDIRYGAARPLPQMQLALLARSISFDHPTRHESMTVTSPLPQGWPWPDTPPNPEAPPWTWRE